MKSLGKVLGSGARTDVLRALHYQRRPVGLRHLAMVAGVHPHSAELALAALEREGLVLLKKTSLRSLYALNRRHREAGRLKAVFDAAERASIQVHNSVLHQRARAILPFIEEAAEMRASARRSQRVT